jgi:hypothetical protein
MRLQARAGRGSSGVIEILRRRGGPTDVQCPFADSVWIRGSDRAAVNPNPSHAPARADQSSMAVLVTATQRHPGAYG